MEEQQAEKQVEEQQVEEQAVAVKRRREAVRVTIICTAGQAVVDPNVPASEMTARERRLVREFGLTCAGKRYTLGEPGMHCVLGRCGFVQVGDAERVDDA